MKRISLVIAALVLATVTTARAETLGVDAVARRTDDTVMIQAGFLRDATLLGVEYAHAFHPNFDVAASASVGIFTAQVAVLPRLRFQRGSWRVTAGAGPSLAYLDEDLFSTDPGRGKLLPTLVGEASVAYLTHSGLTIQATSGVTATWWARNEARGTDAETLLLPSFGVGVGWTF